MLWELYQQSQIADARNAASRAETKSKRYESEVARLEDKVESLALTCQALWEIVREQTGLTDEQLVAKVSEIDLRDGVADGRMTNGVQSCENCGRKTSKRRLSCLYCGEENSREHVFQQ
ncbi:hypothetical protein [Rhodopirellula sp. MGV]|uniref:hypothetical protein n=1 Tax=Rhodopirellula sp. MGV TaxID=2023130 RepID=UPI00117A1BAA|nr:hypothetical protein [Rhodopirellula sp. MGV]